MEHDWSARWHRHKNLLSLSLPYYYQALSATMIIITIIMIITIYDYYTINLRWFFIIIFRHQYPCLLWPLGLRQGNGEAFFPPLSTGCFLAVHNSSIGDLVTDSLTNWLAFTFGITEWPQGLVTFEIFIQTDFWTIFRFLKNCQIFGKNSDFWKNFRFLENF